MSIQKYSMTGGFKMSKLLDVTRFVLAAAIIFMGVIVVMISTHVVDPTMEKITLKT